MAINEGRWTAEIEGDFVVFMIGARVRNPIKGFRAVRLLGQMGAMLQEVQRDPSIGLLGFQTHGGPFGVIVQYWRSFEALEAYAKDPGAKHRPVWLAWYAAAADQGSAAGIWHETYQVAAGQYEAIYGNMPTIGLQKAGRAVSISESRDNARARMSTQVKG